MRRAEKEIKDRGEIDEIIRRSQVCRIALSQDDMPYIVPLSFGYDGRDIYFHTAPEGKKIDIIRVNNRVCFEFEDGVSIRKSDKSPCAWSFSYRSVIGEGVIEEITEIDRKIDALKIIMRQYSDDDWEFPREAVKTTRVWAIRVSRMTGKKSR